MAETILRGPGFQVGSLMDGRVEPSDGPDMEYQGSGFFDVRYSPINKDSIIQGRVLGHLNNPFAVMTDCIPQATGTSALAVAANITLNTAMTLVTVAPGGTSASTAIVPLIPFQGNASSVVNVLAIDFGFTYGTTTATNTTIVVPDSTLFTVGQWIVVGGGGNAGKTLPLITQVTALTDATHIVVGTAPSGSLTNAPIGNANQYATYARPLVTGGSQVAPTAVQPYSYAGVAALLNPPETGTRNVTITANVSASVTGTFTVSGYDIYGVAMNEVITPVANTTVAGKKAFKYIKSVTPSYSDAHNYSIGLGNLAGFHLRTDKWEYTNLFFNGAFATTSNGFLAATTAASGDVRGTIDVSNASGFNSAFDGSRRLAVMASLPLWNIINATPLNAVPMYGAAQT